MAVKKGGKKKARRKKPKKRAVKKPMAKRRKKRSNPFSKVRSKMATRKRRQRRYSGNPGNPGRGKVNIQAQIMDAAGVIGGAVGAGVIANQIPVPDARLKAFIPLAGGLVLAMTKFGAKKPMAAVALGMMAAGGLALVRQFAPNVPLLAGEDDVYVDYVPEGEEENAFLGYYPNDEEEYGQDVADEIEEALTGEPVYYGESEEIGDDWETPGNIM